MGRLRAARLFPPRPAGESGPGGEGQASDPLRLLRSHLPQRGRSFNPPPGFALLNHPRPFLGGGGLVN